MLKAVPATVYAERAKRKHAQRLETLEWGNWKLDPEQLTLTFTSERFEYYIDLEKLTDSAKLLDRIFQVQQKTWATPKVLSDLMAALKDLLNPQGRYCSCGLGRAADPKAAVNAFLNRYNQGS